MALVGFQYEPVSLDVDKVCFEKEQNIPNTCQKSRNVQIVTEWCRCGKLGVLHANVEYLSCKKIEALRYFQLSEMRYNDRNGVMEIVRTKVLQLYLI